MGQSTWLYEGHPYTRLRGGAFLFLTDIGHVVYGTVTSDLGGGGTTVWAADQTDIPCRIDVAGGSEALVAAMISDQTTHIIVIPSGVDVDQADRFAIDGRGTFIVTAVYQKTGELLRTLEVAEA